VDSALKQRLIGAGVLLALIVIVVPMLFSGHSGKSSKGKVSLAIPAQPQPRMQTKILDLAVPASVSRGAPVSVQKSLGLARVEVHKVPAVVDGARPVISSAPPAAVSKPASRAVPKTKVPVQASRKTARAAATRVAAKSHARPIKPVVRPVKPAVKPLAAGTAAQKSYIVSLGAYANRANTKRLLTGLHKLGIAVHAEPLKIGGKAVQKVFAGPFASRAGAEDARLRIRRLYPRIPAVLLTQARTVKTSQASTALPAKQPGAWVVQVAAFRHHPVAEKLVKRLREAGFAAYSDSVKTSRGTFWRVRVGPETRRAAAFSVRDRIAATQHLRGVVVSNR